MILLIIGFFTVILAGIAVFLVDLVFKHQRQLAGVGRSDARTEALERQVRELTLLVHEQAITLDSLASALPAESRIQERVGA